jgi:hypothetical protein
VNHKIGIHGLIYSTILIHAKVKKVREFITKRDFIKNRILPEPTNTAIPEINLSSNQVSIFYFEQRFPTKRIIELTGNIGNRFIP